MTYSTQALTRTSTPWHQHWIRIYRHKLYYLMLAPALILLFLFSYEPMAGIVIAFKQYYPGLSWSECPWVGFENFEFLHYKEFYRVLGNTLAITGLRLLIGFPAPIILALMLDHVRSSKFKRVAQSIVYLPHFMSWIVVAYILESALSPSVGFVNSLMELCGMEKVTFMAKPQYFRGLVTLSGVWKEIGWGTIIYLAAISGIDQSLYEAAEVEGASSMQQLFQITLPLLMPTISVMLVLNIPNLLNAGMDQILPLQNAANLKVSDVLDTYILRNGLQQGKYAVSTAAGLLSSAVKLILLLGTNKVSKSLGGAGLW